MVYLHMEFLMNQQIEQLLGIVDICDISLMIDRYQDKPSTIAMHQARTRSKKAGNLKRYISLGIASDYLKLTH